MVVTSTGGFAEYGFQFDDGWFGLMCALSVVLDRRSREQGLSPRVFQAKEKFGGLRFYASGLDEFGLGAVSFAESMSERLSLRSGQPGLPHNVSGWVATLARSEEPSTICTARPDQLGHWIAGCGPFMARRRLEGNHSVATIDIPPGGADLVGVLLEQLNLGHKVHLVTWLQGSELDVLAEGLDDRRHGMVAVAVEMARSWVHAQTGATGPVSDQGRPAWA